MENTSGQGKLAAVPPEIDRWNWGAFLLNWIWGLGNDTYIALLALVPFVNLPMVFVAGANGSRWAWQNRRWDSVEHFQRVQRQWAKWGVIILLISLAIPAACVSAILYSLNNSDAYRAGVTAVQSNPEAVAALGSPISTGLAQGGINCEAGKGCEADISFSAEGPKGKGTVTVHGTKQVEQWRFDSIYLDVEGTGKRIDLLKPRAQTRKFSPMPPWRADTACGSAAVFASLPAAYPGLAEFPKPFLPDLGKISLENKET
jgi:hypothetical protein